MWENVILTAWPGGPGGPSTSIPWKKRGKMWDTVALYGLSTNPQTMERSVRKGWTTARGGFGFEVKEFVYSYKIERFADPLVI